MTVMTGLKSCFVSGVLYCVVYVVLRLRTILAQ